MRFSGVISLVLAMFFSACDKGPKPEEVTKLFLDSMNKQDFETARKHCTERTLKLVDFLSGIAEMAKQEGSAFADAEPVSNVKCTVTGETAKCTFCCVEERGESDIELVKVEGVWKVDIAFEGFGEENFDSLLDTTYYPTSGDSLFEDLDVVE
jgi:hypothetical protein